MAWLHRFCGRWQLYSEVDFWGEYKAEYYAFRSLALRSQIEAALADRIPSALTLAPRVLRPVMPTGIRAVDELLEGGLPVGAF